MRRLLAVLIFSLTTLIPMFVQASGGSPALTLSRSDKPLLQRGARLFINYCMACHSLAYMRYNQLAKDLGITQPNGEIDTQLIRESFIFGKESLNDTMQSSMPAAEAKRWFGVAPPDLSLEVKAKGTAWVYNYLTSFYQDPSRLWGANNLTFPNTAMPNVLVNLQGIHQAKKNEDGIIDHLTLVKPGLMTPAQFNSSMADLVNFLAYVAEPNRKARLRIGGWVLLFLFGFALLAYLLRKQYWKHVS